MADDGLDQVRVFGYGRRLSGRGGGGFKISRSVLNMKGSGWEWIDNEWEWVGVG